MSSKSSDQTSGKGSTLRFQSGLCYTFFAVILSGLLILILVALSRYLTIEKHIKNQFRSPSQEYYSLSPDRGIVPRFQSQCELNKDISQIYYYHDCCYRGQFQSLPGQIVRKIQYSKNKQHETPSVVVFKNEGILYCIFRSTKTKVEMKKDVEMGQVGGMHAGIRDIYNDISPSVFDVIENEVSSEGDRADACSRVILFGHSLGGALVDLVSYNMINQYPEIWSKTFAFSSGSPTFRWPAAR